jgi:hypothetical protein
MPRLSAAPAGLMSQLNADNPISKATNPASILATIVFSGLQKPSLSNF